MATVWQQHQYAQYDARFDLNIASWNGLGGYAIVHRHWRMTQGQFSLVGWYDQQVALPGGPILSCRPGGGYSPEPTVRPTITAAPLYAAVGESRSLLTCQPDGLRSATAGLQAYVGEPQSFGWRLYAGASSGTVQVCLWRAAAWFAQYNEACFTGDVSGNVLPVDPFANVNGR